MSVTILRGHVLDRLRELPDESVHCCVTSPPYYGLRDYGVEGQLGLEPTLAEYLDNMVAVFREVRRVLRSDGTLWLNIGDSYATGAGAVGNCPGGGAQGEKWAGAKTSPNRMPQAGYKPKDLMGVPWRLAFALQADGWWLRQDIIWAKPNPMPESVTDRCTKSHEYLFLLTKSERYQYDALAIREPATDTGRKNGREGREEPEAARPPGSNARTLARLDYTQPRRVKVKVPEGWDRGSGAHGTIHREGRTEAEYQEVEIPGGRNKRSVWTVPTNAFPEAHFATFPPDLIKPCILAGCPVGGTVLDPFGGAGTTGLVADRLQRDAILIELNPAYADMAERRIRADSPLFSEVA